MNRRDLFRHAAGFAVLAAAPTGFAQAALQAGRDYRVVNPPQRPETGDKVEIIEFFSYGCPHCRDFEPMLNAWQKTLPPDVLLRKVPITFNREEWTVLARVYLTLEVMGLTERLNMAVFNAVQNQNVNFGDAAVRNAWVQKQDVDAKRFDETYKSFAVAGKLQRATQVAAAYQVMGVPMLAIDGKYIASPSLSKSLEAALKVATELVARARAERGRK